ncbi:MAG: prenyltransferase/squalene oxidase repeat-containing protein [Saonia sp.]
MEFSRHLLAMDYSTEIKSILEEQNKNGGAFWSRADEDIHAPHGSSTMDTLEVLGELGATPKDYPILTKAIAFLFDYQTPDGSFKYSRTSSKLPCMTARILAALGRLGVAKDKRAKKSYQQLLDTQWSDGGWRCNTVKLGKSSETDASNPGTTLYVLDAFRFRDNTQEEMHQFEKGIDFLLGHWDTKLPLGPCTFGIGSRFFQIEFPFLRYNLFYYVYVLSFYGHALKDNRFQEAYQKMLVKTRNGKILPENPHKAWSKYAFAKKGEVSNLATERWKEIEFNLKK